MSYSDAIRPVRNRMRKFSYTSVLRQLSGYVQEKRAAGDSKMPYMPWVGERLALWALRDSPRMYGHAPMQRSDLETCLKLAWRNMDSAISWINDGDPATLLMRSVMLAQAPHQLSSDIGAFARQIDLVNRTNPGSKLHSTITDAIGLPPLDYLQLAVFFWLKAEGQIAEVFTPLYTAALANAFGNERLQRFLCTVMCPRERVAEEMDKIEADEWFQPNLMYRFPFTVYQEKWYFWGRPSLGRHLEFAFSDIVGRSDDDPSRKGFENAFEQYVGESLQRSGLLKMNESEVRERFEITGGCCDYALLDGDVIVLFEVKNKALAHTLPASATAKTYQSKLKATILKAAAQLENVTSYVKDDPTLKHARIRRVVVTYGDLMLGTAEYLFSGKPKEDLPLIFSIDQLDRLIEAVRLKQCSLDDFFSDYLKRQEAPKTWSFSPSQLLDAEPYRLAAQPAHLADIFNPFFDGLAAKVGGVMPNIAT